MAREIKGNSVTLQTFKSWGKESIFGFKTVEDVSGRTMVNLIWCKLCAKCKSDILSNPLINESAKVAARSFIDHSLMVQPL